MIRPLLTYINSCRSTKYTLLAYLILIFVVSGLNIKTSSHGFIYKDKVIHLIEYFILGVLFIRYFILSKKMYIKRTVIFTVLAGSLYAVSDEIHQGFVGYFSSGIFGGVRDPDILDVVADITGIIVSVAVYIFVNKLKFKLNGKLNEGF